MKTIIKTRARGRPTIVRGGRYISIAVDPLSHARLLHAAAVVNHHLGVKASNSSVIRAAVAAYVDHLDKVAAKLSEPVPAGAPVARPQDPEDESLGAAQARLASRERYAIKKANEGGTVPFEVMPTYVPGRPFHEVLAAGHRFKREAQGGCVGSLPVGDEVRDLMNERHDSEQGSRS